MGKRREKFDNLVKSLPKIKRVLSARRRLLIWTVVTVGLPVIIWSLYPIEWSGFGKDVNESETTKIVINPKDAKTTKFTEKTKHFQSRKTLWDWLGLAGTLAIPLIEPLINRLSHRGSNRSLQAVGAPRPIKG